MDLKTHTAYAEINIKSNNTFEVRITNEKGAVQFKDIGVGASNLDARNKAKALVESKSIHFLRN